jgi:hypothetical protein
VALPINPNWPLLTDQLALNVGANDTADPAWIDITDRVTSRSMAAGRQDEFDHTQAGSNTYLVRDRDEVFNPANTAGPYYGTLLPYRRVRTLAMWPLTGNIFNRSQPAEDFSFLYDQSSSFEGSGNGGWTAGGTTAPTLNGPSTDWAQHGSKSMKVTMPTGAGGQVVTAVQAPQTGPSPWGLAIGQTYTWSAYVNRPTGGMPNVRLALASGTPITAAAGGFVLTTSATGVTRLAGTFVCQDASNDVPVLFPVAATTAGQVLYLDAVQLELGAAVSAYASTGPTVYQPFIGYVERWPKTWTHQGMYGWTTLSCVDALAPVAQTKFVDAVYHQALSLGAVGLWPLTEPSGSSSGGNVATTTQQPPLAVQAIGVAPGTVAFGATDGPAGVGVAVATLTPTNTTNGSLLSTGLSTPVGGAAGLTLAAWFNVPTAPSSAPSIIACAWNGPNNYLAIGVGTDGGLRVYALLPGMTTETSYPAGAYPVADGKWHLGGITVTCTGSTMTITTTADGVSTGSTTISGLTGTAGSVGPFATVTAGGTPKGRLLAGSVCYVQAYSTAIDWVTFVTGSWSAGNDGYAGDSTATRFARVAKWLGHPGLISGATSNVRMVGCQIHNGRGGLDVLAQIADTEGGTIFVSSGFLVFRSRRADQLDLTPVATFGEATGETSYEGDIELPLDPDYVYNDIAVTRSGGATVRVVDAASQLAYFARQFELTTYSDSDAEATDHANYLLYRSKAPLQRVGPLTVQAAARGGAAWRAVLNSYQAVRIGVRRRPAAGSAFISDHRITRVTHDSDRNSWKTTISASPTALTTFWVLGDATYGVLGSTTIAGW